MTMKLPARGLFEDLTRGRWSSSRGARALFLLGGVWVFGGAACSSKEDSEAQGEGGFGAEAGASSQADHQAPVFGGVMEAQVNGADVTLSWSTAYDDVSPPEHLVYQVYAGHDDGPVNIRDALATSLPGATSVTLFGLRPDKYRFVVRAIDGEQNRDENRHSVTATVSDESPPVFSGVTGVVSGAASSAIVQWKPASDDVTPQAALRYLVYVSEHKDDLFDQKPQLTNPGTLKYIVNVPAEANEIWVGVRSQDESGNVDTNERRTSTRAPELEPPTFSGLSAVVANGTSVTLRWAPAIDNATASTEMVYRVFSSKKSGDYNLLKPDALTAPGATQWTISGLDPETPYFFLVQAQDLAGNRDGNHVERSIETGSADVTPPKIGRASCRERV